MCRPNYDRDNFFAKGAAKGWPVDRIQRAWDAHQAQSAREDARAILKAPAPLKIGETVRYALPEDGRQRGSGTIKAECDGYFWVQWSPGTDPTTHIARYLERVAEHPQ